VEVLMSQERQTQWMRRIERLQALKERFARLGRYDRARRAYLAVQRVYDRWSDEVFATARPR
jgi:hypothetical protein